LGAIVSVDVGKRLKAVRLAQGLSQRQLAARAGVTNSMISLIEQNRTSPSIASLKLILDAVPMTFSEFFSIENAENGKFVHRQEELLEVNPATVISTGPEGMREAISFRQVGNASKHAIQMLHERYEPGADTGPELYTHEAEEAGIVISGEIELTVGEVTETLKAGDAYLFDSRLPHRFRNASAEPCVIVSACTPPSF
jgi:transcriptional regulator with XRE-family HTH domain